MIANDVRFTKKVFAVFCLFLLSYIRKNEQNKSRINKSWVETSAEKLVIEIVK